MARKRDGMKRRRLAGTSVLVCVDCGYPMFIPRMRGKLRAHGHVKTMWCPFCKEITDHIERGIV